MPELPRISGAQEHKLLKSLRSLGLLLFGSEAVMWYFVDQIRAALFLSTKSLLLAHSEVLLSRLV